jgi:SnoaL-like domain
MPYSPQAVADRLEIQDLLTRYAWAVDTQDWDLFRTVFTPDAHLDYTANPGGVKGSLDEVVPWLKQSLSAFAASQHLLSNFDIVIDGDRATARTQMTNPMGAKLREGGLHWFFIGGSYHDDLIRVDGAWKIATRIEKTGWFQGTFPPELLFD